MLTLYVKTGCLFCRKVLDTGEELGLEFEVKDVANEEVAKELIARGGKEQTPYLVDSDRSVEMYDSMAIDAYLRENYAKK